MLLLITYLFFPLSSFPQEVELVLRNPSMLRTYEAKVLEPLERLPKGTVLKMNGAAAPVFYDFRNAQGKVERSTNGFFPLLRVQSLPAGSGISESRLVQLNQAPGGIFLSSVDGNDALGRGNILPLPQAGEPGSQFEKYFYPNGKRRKNSFGKYLQKRFAGQWNREIPLASMPETEQKKWLAIYAEMRSRADRTVESPRAGLFLDRGSAEEDSAWARRFSEEFERSGLIQEKGAWSIAVLGTAPRHGFANVPCAEFVSEVIRQSYQKSGFSITEDFRGSNSLLWSNTAAVVNLATALVASGWIPWDPNEFQPIAGAIGFHEQATSPGHTYLIAGAGGRFIVDNGSPRGRDLYRDGSRDLIGLMYNLGTFVLPPGIIPARWPSAALTK